MDSLQLLPQVFSILSLQIEKRCGLHYGLVDLDHLRSKTSPRARELGFDSLLDYYYYLRYDPAGDAELDALIDTLLIHETYFFREADQLSQLVDTFLAPKVEAGSRPRVWCAAASSGEEPYTLAMLLSERDLLGRVELVASDVSRRVLAHAQGGVYTGRALRAVSGTVASHWLESQGEGVQVSASLRDAIDWRLINLLDTARVAALGKFDAILCRNVLIYFRDPIKVRVVAQLAASLTEGGLLLVGASESLLSLGTALACEERSGSFYFRKCG